SRSGGSRERRAEASHVPEAGRRARRRAARRARGRVGSGVQAQHGRSPRSARLDADRRAARRGRLRRVHDPVAMPEAKHRLGDRVTFATSGYDALIGADALAVVTDWNEYRHPDFARIKQTLKRPIIVDGRNLYALNRMASM